MHYYLITTHKPPMFYRVDGSIADVELPYADNKDVRTLNAKGELQIQTIRGINGRDPIFVANGKWMVKDGEKCR